jgi:hypothetical protein
MYQMMNYVREQQNQILKMKPISPNKKQSVSDTDELEESVFDMTEEFRDDEQLKLKPLFKVPRDLRPTLTRVVDGVCEDCEKQRCPVCNGCPVDQKDLETAHCQRCICLPYKENEPLNETGIPLGELVRKRQGAGFSKKKNGGLK